MKEDRTLNLRQRACNRIFLENKGLLLSNNKGERSSLVFLQLLHGLVKRRARDRRVLHCKAFFPLLISQSKKRALMRLNYL